VGGTICRGRDIYQAARVDTVLRRNRFLRDVPHSGDQRADRSHPQLVESGSPTATAASAFKVGAARVTSTGRECAARFLHRALTLGGETLSRVRESASFSHLLAGLVRIERQWVERTVRSWRLRLAPLEQCGKTEARSVNRVFRGNCAACGHQQSKRREIGEASGPRGNGGGV